MTYTTREKIRHMVVFAMFAALMFASKKLLEVVPNVHLNALFIVVLTVVYRTRALIPIYVYVLLDGLFCGFALWWLPYLYAWTVLWGTVMLVPQKAPRPLRFVLYALFAALHGLVFGVLTFPGYALQFGIPFTLPSFLSVIAAGFPYDLIHALSDLLAVSLAYPLCELLFKLEQKGR